MEDSVTSNRSGDVEMEYSDDNTASSNGLTIDGMAPFGLEKLYDYEPGGHHPIHLGDILHERYRVIHKLGSGGFAIVWLCLDTQAEIAKYIAVKVIVSDGSNEKCAEKQVIKLTSLGLGHGPEGSLFCLPLDEFTINGPNGVHFAFVYNVLGPRVSELFHLFGNKDIGSILRGIARQSTEALSILHNYGMCHGGKYIFAI